MAHMFFEILVVCFLALDVRRRFSGFGMVELPSLES